MDRETSNTSHRYALLKRSHGRYPADRTTAERDRETDTSTARRTSETTDREATDTSQTNTLLTKPYKLYPTGNKQNRHYRHRHQRRTTLQTEGHRKQTEKLQPLHRRNRRDLPDRQAPETNKTHVQTEQQTLETRHQTDTDMTYRHRNRDEAI